LNGGGTRRIAAVAALVLALATPAAAMDAVPLAFDDVVARADCIVHGTVADVTAGRDADGIPATWIALDVTECLKGAAGSRLVFKQAGVPAPLADGTMLRIPGLPRYRTGDEVVLFLHRPSGRGFTSPVGLGQGLFRVERRDGERVVRSPSASGSALPSPSRASSLAGAAGSPPPAGAVESLPDFLDRVRAQAVR
jgi:hypothetical protein